jgi:hypothetical protein
VERDAATTDEFALLPLLRVRFKLTLRFEFYSPKNLRQIGVESDLTRAFDDGRFEQAAKQ